MKLLRKGWTEQLDQFGIERLVNRNRNGDKTAKVLIESDSDEIKVLFSGKKRNAKTRCSFKPSSNT